MNNLLDVTMKYPWWLRIKYALFGFPKFEPQIIVNDALSLTIFLFEDVSYVAKPVGSETHFVDELISFDGRLVGVQVWAKLPLDRQVKPTTTVGPTYTTHETWSTEQIKQRIDYLQDKLEDGGKTEFIVKRWTDELVELQRILDTRILPR